jgi:hypothetical protein
MPIPHRPRSALLRHSAVALAISLGFAGAAQAQSSEGSLFGRTQPSATVTVLNTETGATRQITADANGNFTFSKLTPGRYKVTSGGKTTEVSVAIGSGTEVKLAAVELERIEIVSSRVRSSIDVSTVEANSVFTAEQVRALPVARNVNAVAFLAPGVVQGDDGLGAGKLPSFGGASVGENGYYINGFDVTNIRNFLSYAELPFEAISQQQVKAGGYGAEYGRSLGGVVSLLTKRGTNEWKFGGAAYYEPKQLRSRGQNVANREPDGPGLPPEGYTLYARDDERTRLNYNVFAGGPIIKDKLFVFALVEGRRDVTSDFARTSSSKLVSDKPRGMVKVDFTPNDMLNFELTAISNKERIKISDYDNGTNLYATSHLGAAAASEQTQGGTVLIGKGTAYLTDNLTVSALVGKTDFNRPRTTGASGDDAPSKLCPPVADTPALFTEIGCWGPPYDFVTVRDASARPYDTDKRKAARLDVEYILGNHTLRAGLDNQKFTSYEAGTAWQAGGYYYRYFLVPASGRVNGVSGFTPGTQYVRRQQNSSTSGEFEVLNDAMYIEDSWKVTKNVLLYGGVRSESFENRNADGKAFVKADNLIAPRFGASWDVNGDSSLKIYGNAGRYYIPVAANTNIRATRSENFIREFFTFQSRDPRTQAPIGLGTSIGTPQIIASGALPDPGTVADTKLNPMNQDELILGFQKALSKNWNFGVKYVQRKINDGMDDFCGHYPMEQWAADNKYTDAFGTIGLAQCIIVNPGRDVTLKMDLAGDGKLVEKTIPASYFNLAKYERKYNAIELTLERPFDGKWSLNASYTWSQSRGSAEGYVQSNLDQEDAGITQDFDFGSFTDGAYGFLPNDRRHVVKAYGVYAINDQWRVGANAVFASGRPKSCIGYVPDTVPDFAESGNYTSASSYYCQGKLNSRGSAGRTPWSHSFDLQVSYTPKVATGRLTLSADVFNILNSQRVTETNEVGDYSRNDTRASLNYGLPTSYQSPRTVRLSARYEF